MGNGDPDCQNDRQHHWPKRNIEVLRHYSEVVYAITLILCFLTFSMIPPVIVFIPTFAVAALIIQKRRVPEHVQLTVQRQRIESGRLFIRTASGHDMVLLRAPGLSVLLIPKMMHDMVGENGFKARLHHEFGHLKQFDFAVIVSLLFFVAVWGLLTVRTLPALLLGVHEPYISHPDENVLHQTGTFWMVVYLVIAAVALVTLRTVLHQREFLADAYGEIGSEGGVSRFLHGKTRQKLHSLPASLVDRFSNEFTHPDFAQRLEAIRQGVSIRISRVWFSGVALTLVGLLTLFVVAQPSGSLARWGLLHGFAPLLVLVALWGVASHRIHRLTDSVVFSGRAVASFVAGLFSGAAFAVCLVWGIELATGIASPQYNFLYAGIPIWILVSGLVTWCMALTYKALGLKSRFWALEALVICAITVSGLTLPNAFAGSHGVEVGDLPVEFFLFSYGVLSVVLLGCLAVLLAASFLVGLVARRWFSG